jgi:hypothetical protein
MRLLVQGLPPSGGPPSMVHPRDAAGDAGRGRAQHIRREGSCYSAGSAVTSHMAER